MAPRRAACSSLEPSPCFQARQPIARPSRSRRRAGGEGFLNELQRAVWSVNPNLPLADVQPLRHIYDKSVARTSFTLVMLSLAGGMALLLGMVGIYGVISYSVSQRTREIGIRMALGAQRSELTRLFLRDGLRLALIGVACGLGAAAILMRLMVKLLFEVKPVDPATYGPCPRALWRRRSRPVTCRPGASPLSIR